jgi:hypothetical protein
MAHERPIQVHGTQPVPVPEAENGQQVLGPRQASEYLEMKYGIKISRDSLRQMARDGMPAVLLSPPGSKRLRVGFSTETLDRLAQGQLFDISKLHLRNRRRKCHHHQAINSRKEIKAASTTSSSTAPEESEKESLQDVKTKLRHMIEE